MQMLYVTILVLAHMGGVYLLIEYLRRKSLSFAALRRDAKLAFTIFAVGIFPLFDFRSPFEWWMCFTLGFWPMFVGLQLAGRLKPRLRRMIMPNK